MKISEGEYYAWGVINTNDEVGNGFLRASYDRFGIDVAENIEITSSLPASLQIEVFPKHISADAERTIDVFVSLVDSDGLPAVTPEDVPIELFSDENNVVDKLDDRMKTGEVVIKKGEFGYHFREKMNLAGFEKNEITGTIFPSIYWPKHYSEELDREMQLLLKMGVLKTESFFKRKNETIFPVSMTGSFVKDQNGKPLEFILLVQDITDIRQAEGELKLTQHMLIAVNKNLERKVQEKTAELGGCPDRRH